MREKEEEELDKFREHCKNNKINIPDGYDDHTRFLLRILQGKGDYAKKINDILAHNEWK